MQSNWKAYWGQKRNKQIFISTIISLCLILFVFLNFLTYNEHRAGINFNDPVLKLLVPNDFSTSIFLLIYSFCLLGIIISLRTPQIFINLLQAYGILTVLRMISLYLIHLEPPVGIILLNDKLLQFSFYSGRDNLKDLFFSGHTATLFLFSFIFKDKRLKLMFCAIGILIGFLLMKQHVHYSIDVLFAPVFSFVAIVLQRRIGGYKK